MKAISLPEPATSGETSIEHTLARRRSVRSFSDASLTIEDIGQLAWSAQGITDQYRGLRTAPSAGATYPIEIYLLLNGVEGLANGVYHYRPADHSLRKVIDGDQRARLHRVALAQDSIIEAPVVMAITGVPARTSPRYGDRAWRYMYMEAGHVAQNVYLQGVSRGIGTVVIGAFDDDGVGHVLRLVEGEYPLYLMPLGR